MRPSRLLLGTLLAALLAMVGVIAGWPAMPLTAGAAAPPRAAHPPSGSATGALPAAEASPDIAQRLTKWKPVEMPWSGARLSPRERRMVGKLVAGWRFPLTR